MRELVEQAVLAVKHVSSVNNIADIFTKALEKEPFQKLRAKLLNLPRED